jgi:ABC-type branched-subunit amino acid transport system ATPase component
MIQFSQVSKHFGSVRALDHFQTIFQPAGLIGFIWPQWSRQVDHIENDCGLNRPDRVKSE